MEKVILSSLVVMHHLKSRQLYNLHESSNQLLLCSLVLKHEGKLSDLRREPNRIASEDDISKKGH